MLTSACYTPTQNLRKVFKTKCLSDLIIACLQESLGRYNQGKFLEKLGLTRDTLHGIKSALSVKKALWKAELVTT